VQKISSKTRYLWEDRRGRKDEEEDVSKYCMDLRKKETVECEITQNRKYVTINIHEHASRY
jgi:hypothetical protein